ncbi:transcriptional regulator with XRE-family HTH domain [Salirhabdus euzebyi]|uniref:Transcriptional regulator with XRE-family HTH domain n=1 Tax=Salirhabdus euzebyi TaxID=394506 RepID=A0A841Q5K2_9BACI|nr:transcriptional regulator with XRE-family HTH domain [Salirhabdus euzebyi]
MRKQKNMTLQDLSDVTGLSVGFISQVERGASNLAISSLKKIADAFEVNISEFFEDRNGYTYVTRKDEQQVFQVNGLDTLYANLGGNFDKRVLAPYILILEPSQKKKDSFKFSGEEFYYVIKGAVKFTIDNKEYEIYEGDSIHFPSHLEHFGENISEEETHLLGVITPVVF